MNAPVIYIPNFVWMPDLAFERLWNELDWVRHDKVPRSEYYCNVYDLPYTYGMKPYERTYNAQPWSEDILRIRTQLFNEDKGTYEVCFLNRYEDSSDQLGWHSDDSPEMDDNRSIAIISLYPPNVGEREIWFRPIPHRNEEGKAIAGPVEKIRLGHGSLCLMAAGMQDTHQHRIPKADRADAGPRISLTYRGLATV